MIGVIAFIIVFAIGYLLFGRKNPYIKCHKNKWQSEKDYLDYLDWLDESGGDLPIDEYKFHEDKEVIKEINKNFN